LISVGIIAGATTLGGGTNGVFNALGVEMNGITVN
jgi:Flp pilus assembly pilin Flp